MHLNIDLGEDKQFEINNIDVAINQSGYHTTKTIISYTDFVLSLNEMFVLNQNTTLHNNVA